MFLLSQDFFFIFNEIQFTYNIMHRTPIFSWTSYDNYLLLCHHYPEQTIEYFHHPRKFFPGSFQFITHLPNLEVTTSWFLSPHLLFTVHELRINGINSMHSFVQELFCSVFLRFIHVNCIIHSSFTTEYTLYYCMDILQFVFPFSSWGYF